MTESDDMENWCYATESSTGTIARTLAYNYQMGMGHEQPVPGLKGAVTTGEFTEETNRNYYVRWAAFMAGTSWTDLMAGAND
jgi:hypothetical protein